jgi:GNAT superfamily N-acetyltransferase
MSGEKIEKIDPKQLRIEKIASHHSEDIENFESSLPELKNFLVEDAHDNQEKNISTTYLWFYNPENRLVAYITILSDSIRIHGTKLGKSFIEDGILYKTMPGMKIGRLSVDKRYERRGIGAQTILFALSRALELNERIGCRFLIVDAKPDSVHFYRKLGFEILKEREKGTIPMYYDLTNLVKRFKEKKFRICDVKEQTPL